MRFLEITSWKEKYGESLDVHKLRNLFQPKEEFRVSHYSYEPDATFSGQTIEGECFVLSGTFTYIAGAENVTLKAGDHLYFPTGRYEFVAYDESVELVMVWRVPK